MALLPDYYDTLDLPRDATSAEIVQAYRLAKSTYGENSQAAFSMFDETQLHTIRNEIEAAYQTLSSSEKKQAYDAILNQQQQTASVQGKNVVYLNGKEGNSSVLKGAQLRSLRKSQGITLQAAEQNSAIPARVLQALEEENRALLQQYPVTDDKLFLLARQIGISGDEITRSYQQICKGKSKQQR